MGLPTGQGELKSKASNYTTGSEYRAGESVVMAQVLLFLEILRRDTRVLKLARPNLVDILKLIQLANIKSATHGG